MTDAERLRRAAEALRDAFDAASRELAGAVERPGGLRPAGLSARVEALEQAVRYLERWLLGPRAVRDRTVRERGRIIAEHCDAVMRALHEIAPDVEVRRGLRERMESIGAEARSLLKEYAE